MIIDDHNFAVIYWCFSSQIHSKHSLYYVAGPVMSKFTTAFRELGTYKELLRSQVIDYYHTASKFDLPFSYIGALNTNEMKNRMKNSITILSVNLNSTSWHGLYYFQLTIFTLSVNVLSFCYICFWIMSGTLGLNSPHILSHIYHLRFWDYLVNFRMQWTESTGDYCYISK